MNKYKFEKPKFEDYIDLLNKELKGKTIESIKYRDNGLDINPIYNESKSIVINRERSQFYNIEHIDNSNFSCESELNKYILNILQNGVSGLYFDNYNKSTNFDIIFRDVKLDYIIVIFEGDKLEFSHQNIYYKNICTTSVSTDDFISNAAKAINKCLSNDFKSTMIILESSEDYIYDIARYRALAHMIGSIYDKIGLDKKTIIISKTKVYPSPTESLDNVIKYTYQSMSTVLSGIDGLMVLPFDSNNLYSKKVSNRISRNIYNIISEESYLDKVYDPLSGSYLIEEMTKQIAELIYKKL